MRICTVYCFQVIENFKERPVEMVANTAFELIAQSSLVHRHVGWMLLEDLTRFIVMFSIVYFERDPRIFIKCLRYKWNLISPEMCLSLRSRVFEAIDTIVDEVRGFALFCCCGWFLGKLA